jgi:hypothetical protein
VPGRLLVGAAPVSAINAIILAHASSLGLRDSLGADQDRDSRVAPEVFDSASDEDALAEAFAEGHESDAEEAGEPEAGERGEEGVARGGGAEGGRGSGARRGPYERVFIDPAVVRLLHDTTTTQRHLGFVLRHHTQLRGVPRGVLRRLASEFEPGVGFNPEFQMHFIKSVRRHIAPEDRLFDESRHFVEADESA